MCTGACPVPASCKTLEGRSYHSCFGSCSALRERRVEQSETEKPHPQIWASIHAPAQTVPSPEYPRLHLHEALPSESAWHMASLAHMPWPTLHMSDVQSSSAEKQHPFQKGLSARDLPEGQAGTIIAHITLAQDTAKLGMRKWTEVKASAPVGAGREQDERVDGCRQETASAVNPNNNTAGTRKYYAPRSLNVLGLGLQHGSVMTRRQPALSFFAFAAHSSGSDLPSHTSLSAESKARQNEHGSFPSAASSKNTGAAVRHVAPAVAISAAASRSRRPPAMTAKIG